MLLPTKALKPSPIKPHKNCCPDFDDECIDVPDHLFCYLGERIGLGRAKGYCPHLLGMASPLNKSA